MYTLVFEGLAKKEASETIAIIKKVKFTIKQTIMDGRHQISQTY